MRKTNKHSSNQATLITLREVADRVASGHIATARKWARDHGIDSVPNRPGLYDLKQIQDAFWQNPLRSLMLGASTETASNQSVEEGLKKFFAMGRPEQKQKTKETTMKFRKPRKTQTKYGSDSIGFKGDQVSCRALTEISDLLGMSKNNIVNKSILFAHQSIYQPGATEPDWIRKGRVWHDQVGNQEGQIEIDSDNLP